MQQCLGWLRGGRGVPAAVSRLVRKMLRFDVLRRRRMKNWMKDSESTDRADSAVWVDGPTLYNSTAVIMFPSRNTQ